MDEELQGKVLKSGTSIIGIVCKDGIILAGDRKATAGNYVLEKNAKKVEFINDYLLIAGTGVAADIQMLKRISAAELRLKELRSKQKPSVKEAAGLISMLTFRNIRQFSTILSIVGSLVAGYNEDGTLELYSIEPAGGLRKVEDYDANFGSGMPFILGLLERNYKKDMTVKQGAELAVEAIKSSTQRDTGSGHGIDVFAITKEGIKQVVDQEIVPEYKEAKESKEAK
jgi:proteasome beta subunit